MTPIELHDIFVIGENDSYRFCIGRVAHRWIGFATESSRARTVRQAFASEGLPVDPTGLFLFPEVGEDYELGLHDRERAILLTGAVAQDPESAYGGVDRWFVEQRLRGDPNDFRCGRCERMGCDGSRCRHEDYEYEELP